MFDVYVVDLEHPRDQLGRARMRLAADSLSRSWNWLSEWAEPHVWTCSKVRVHSM